PAGDAGSKGIARETVAAGAWSDADYRPARFYLAQAAGNRERNILTVARIRDVIGQAALRNRDLQAIEQDSAFAIRPSRHHGAVRAEGARTWGGLDVAARSYDSWNQCQERVVCAARRDGRYRVFANNSLLGRALNIYDWRCGADRDRLRERTN